MPVPLYDFGGDGPPLNVAVANGFPPQTYRPLIAPLSDRYHAISLLPRALWDSAQPTGMLPSWRQMGDDLLAGLRERDLSGVIAVGHSFGGVASMLAAIREPGRFRALVLLDPTLLPPLFLGMIGLLRALGQGHRFPLAQGARRRRARFESVEEAYGYWRDKPLFGNWPEASIRLYAESMTRPSVEGGVELTWPPEWEARYYENILTDVWREVPKLRWLLPVLAIRGTETDTFTARSCRKFRRLVPGAAMAEIAGHGHLFPQSAPEETRRIIEGWLSEQGL